MELTEFDDPLEFNDKIRQESKDLIEKELMLGLVQLIIDDPDHYETKPFLAVMEDNEEVVLSAFMTPPWNILVNSTVESDHPFEILADRLMKSGYSIPGVNGPRDSSEIFRRIWCDKSGLKSRLHMEMRLFVLNELNTIKKTGGHMISADLGHLDLLADWGKKFHLDVGMNINDDFILRHVKYQIETGNAFIWMDDGPVCMTFRERPHDDGVTIGFVYTPDELRNRGYATNLVESVSRYSLERGYNYCSLFTDLSNPTSNSIYLKIGYRPVCDYIHYSFL